MSIARDVIRAWGRILSGYTPSLSIEITRECPLRCPGCYAYGDDHLGGEVTLREVADFKGQALIDGVLRLVERHRPIHVSIVGGEPLVRYRELNALLPQLADRGIHMQLVTSAVRPIPIEWASIPGLQICVSIDGLQPEHDARRKPATYPRILKHIEGHRITVHCTVTRQQVNRDGYLDEFVAFWSAQAPVQRIWMSLYTPQIGEISDERLRPADRRRVIEELQRLRQRYPKLDMREGTIAAYADSSLVARRVHVRPDDDLHLGRLRAADHAVPVRRRPRLHQLRLHGLGGTGGRLAPQGGRSGADRPDLRDLAADRPGAPAPAGRRGRRAAAVRPRRARAGRCAVPVI